MNFLAHGFLSRNSEFTLIGNFIGDFVKGRQVNNYSPEIAKGIKLHRLIDEFTDSHRIVIKSKNRIRIKYNHYTGVVIDMFYDHILAKNWEKYSREPLELFSNKLYTIINDHIDLLPEKARQMIPWMIKYNWLSSYSTIEGIDRALKGMSRRTSFNSGMENASNDLKEQYQGFSEDFMEFFPELIKFSDSVKL